MKTLNKCGTLYTSLWLMFKKHICVSILFSSILIEVLCFGKSERIWRKTNTKYVLVFSYDLLKVRKCRKKCQNYDLFMILFRFDTCKRRNIQHYTNLQFLHQKGAFYGAITIPKLFARISVELSNFISIHVCILHHHMCKCVPGSLNAYWVVMIQEPANVYVYSTLQM